MKKTLLYLSMAVTLFTASCSKEDGVDEPTRYPLEGRFNSDDLVINFTGDEAVIEQFGDHRLGTNPSLIKVGDPYIRNIEETEVNKWSAELVQSEYKYDYDARKDILESVGFIPVTITRYDDKSFSMTEYDGWDIIWKKYTGTINSGGNGGGGNGGGGNGGGSGHCIESTWYSAACGDPKGVVWKFNGGRGSFANKDCNGICTPMTFKFSYTITGNTCNLTYDAVQDYVQCTGYPDTRPPKPKDGSFTFTCSGDKLTVTSGNGTNVFTK